MKAVPKSLTDRERVRIHSLIHDWHEAGRTSFKPAYQNLNYDSEAYVKVFIESSSKWTLLNEGTSGAFMLENATGNVYRCKAYGVSNRKKLVGNLSNITGGDLRRNRWL